MQARPEVFFASLKRISLARKEHQGDLTVAFVKAKDLC